ncbi:MAG: hypothetical protein ABIQ55_08610 [Gemmatimonadaceae bacterium]
MPDRSHYCRVARRVSTAMSVSLLALGIASCSSSESGGITEVPPGTVVVEMPGNSFSPFNTIVKVNGSVAFNFPGDEHDVTFVSKIGAPASIPVTKSKVVTRTFTTVGVFDYDCKVHPGMSGQVTVTQ